MDFLNGMSLMYIVLGIHLLCMALPLALMSLAAPCFWRSYYGKLSILWVVAFTVFCIVSFSDSPYFVVLGGAENSINLLSSLLFLLFSYLPRVFLFFTLLAIGGGIQLIGNLVGTPKLNVFLLVVGWLVSGFFGTLVATGLLIPIALQANAHRQYRLNFLVFFLLEAISISGYLTLAFFPPSPPQDLDFLQLEFPWRGFAIVCAVCATILTLFFALDTYLFRKEGYPRQPDSECGAVKKLSVMGAGNLFFLIVLAAVALLPGIWPDSPSVTVYIQPLHLSVIVSYALAVCIIIAVRFLNRQKNC